LISHCGGHSVFESLQCGKPVLGVPIRGDQFSLCMKVKKMGAGILSNINDIKQLSSDFDKLVTDDDG